MATKKTIKKTPKAPTMPVPLVIENSSVKDKLKQPRVFIPLLIIVLILTAFFLRSLFVAALVNGQPIARFSVIKELEKQSGKQALSALVNQVLISQEVKKKNIQVSQKELDSEVKKIEDSLKQQGQNLDTALAAQGMTKQDLFMQMNLRISVEKLLADKIKVTDKEVADYIEKNKDTFPAEMKEAEIKKAVGDQLKQQKLAKESQGFLEGLQKSAKINYFVNY